MTDRFKYNKTGNEGGSIFKGNWAINPASVGGGPSIVTGFKNGIEPPHGGYTIYGPGENVRVASNDSELLYIIGKIGGPNINVESALYWASSTDDVLISTHDFEDIITNGLSFGFDENYLSTYKYNYNKSIDFSLNQSITTLSQVVGQKSYLDDTSKYNQIDNITIQVLLEKTGTATGYANHPISKWNRSSIHTASFVLYHFENYQNNGADGRIGFYANTQNNGWASITNQYRMQVGEKVLVTLAYGGGDTHYWINDNIFGIISNRGTLSPTVAPGSDLDRNLDFSGPHGQGTSKVHKLMIYDRRLTESEILHNYQIIQNRL